MSLALGTCWAKCLYSRHLSAEATPTNSCHITLRELCCCRDYPGYSPGLEPTQSQTNNPTRSQSNTRGAGVVEEGAVEVQIL
jgi:hypothetical protein